jgi:hypothetical protein
MLAKKIKLMRIFFFNHQGTGLGWLHGHGRKCHLGPGNKSIAFGSEKDYEKQPDNY